MGYHADAGELEGCKQQMQDEIAFFKGTQKHPLYVDASKASEAAAKIKTFTETWPDPFSPSYAYANPWSNKKENKGKKERPAGPTRPPMQKGSVNL